MILLDTNVLSETLKPDPHPAVVSWLRGVQEATGITAVTVAELSAGVAALPAGRRRDRLTADVEAVVEDFRSAESVMPFDTRAGWVYGQVVASRRSSGRPISALDAQIAAIALSSGARLATRNVKDFDGVGIELVDPWSGECPVAVHWEHP